MLTKTRFTDLCYGYNAFWADQLYMLDLPQTEVDDAHQMVRGDGFGDRSTDHRPFRAVRGRHHRSASFRHDRYHGVTNLNTFRDGFRVLWTILQDRLHARQIRRLANAAR